ncbi:para-nitrobenzyl esterase [Kribbella amoyensis]|uniref:Carboxylic ester hydrolase n=1 Tax=Kribbella amoyensis TaxID=996641 RepID=A0A561BN15_9ACTN|nr:carboxylesterase family protein [Kribbella amoyensis]TWD80259.1 para-nitrobenzyl esterase [Kribbella amoyensis]
MRLRSAAALIAASSLLLATTPLALAFAGTEDSVVTTEQGKVRGLTGETTRTFRGIPYAAPPTGDARWRSPGPAQRWTGIRDATQYADPCAQGEHPIGIAGTSEDCLYLDVTTPKTPGRDRPVVVWIHGGSFTNGATQVYDAERFAAKGDVVVVQIQYRLGALGFLASPLLGGDRSGNFGLEDQQAALRWVQRNAAAFGGSPRTVAIMGESAGAYSVCDHLVSPGSAGLFQRAIVQSGPCAQDHATNYAAPRPRADAEKYGRDLAASLGCTTAECLRKVTPARLLEATKDDEFGPVLGGPVLPLHPAKALLTSRVNRVPVLHGVNHDEVHGQIGAQESATGTPTTTAAYEDEVRRTFGADADRILAEYADVRPAGLALATVLSDAQWAYPAFRSNALLALRMPTYSFEFAGDAPWYRGLDRPTWPVGSHHLSDVAYFLDTNVFEPLTPAQNRLADELITRWSTFARTGNPNTSGTQYWPRATPVDRQVQSLDPAGVTRTDFVRDHRIAFWASL